MFPSQGLTECQFSFSPLFYHCTEEMPAKQAKKSKKEEKKARKRARDQGKVLVQQARLAGDLGRALRNDLIEQVTDYTYRIKIGFVPGMKVEGMFYANAALAETLMEELVRSG